VPPKQLAADEGLRRRICLKMSQERIGVGRVSIDPVAADYDGLCRML
jgi:hypothetical protein